MQREAIFSSRIEGTYAGAEDLALFDLSEIEPPRSDVREVANYRKALDFGTAAVGARPLTMALVRELHARLLVRVRGADKTPGEYRRVQNFIGTRGATLRDARYVPPPVLQMQDALGAFDDFLRATSEMPPLVRYALIHYQFEAIHPFIDGNGRVGRLMIALLLHQDGLLDRPLLSLSGYLERNRDEYYRELLAVSVDGAWDQWISFFLDAVREASIEGSQRARQLVELRADYRRRVVAPRASGLLPLLVDELFQRQALTIAVAAAKLDVTPAAAQRLIERLVQLGILTEATGRRRNRIFLAREILAAIERS